MTDTTRFKSPEEVREYLRSEWSRTDSSVVERMNNIHQVLHSTTKGRHRPHLSESSADRRLPRPSPLVQTPRPLRIGGFGLNHLPSGRFAANGAWLAVQVMAHNLARWTARIGLGQQIVTTKTLRRRVFALVGRLTRSARRLTLHLPKRWPWEEQVSRALARLRAIPLRA